jgi:TonB family protein
MVDARPHGNRAHTRRKLSPMAYVELGQENGGILLNLGEGGFAVQSALALTSREFSELRFQVPAVQGWLTAAGRIVWISDSNKEAGIQFTELPGDARKEIQRWVLAEGEPEKTAERVVAPMRQNPPRQTVEAPHGRSGVAPQAQSRQSTRANGTHAERERAAVPPRETVVPVVEQPAQDFHFTDYSMFAADAGKAGTWVEPVRRTGSWRRAIFGVLVAVLFFVLGATVGRETVERWIADVAGWAQNQVSGTPKVTPPVAPAATTGTAEANNQAKNAANDAHPGAQDPANPNPGSAAASETEKTPTEENKNAETPPSKSEAVNNSSATDSRNAADSTPGSAVAAARPRRSTDSVAPRDNREMNNAPSGVTSEHSILVNAPGPGSPPFFVNLPGEAVSASGAIAISARRTLEILPRPAGFGSERVVIGKLISHSEPFYPAEARKQHLEGNVELQARVGRTGQIINVIPVSGPRLLSSAAMAAVREWRYEPTFVNGDPAETLAEITVVFRLR